MSGSYEPPITIEAAIQSIVSRRYLLPGIQRKFVWKTKQIEVLFDSIMRGYPISAFMFWEVREPRVKSEFRFYQFLEKYCERFAENNPDFDTKGHGDFYAVIDGQQRLTALYIGLKGTYAFRTPRKWWPSVQDDSILPPRRLYLNLSGPMDEEQNDDRMMYEFAFLTEKELVKSEGSKKWFLVGDVFALPSPEDSNVFSQKIGAYFNDLDLSKNDYAVKTVAKLYNMVRRESLVHYYREGSQDINQVLSIFIRTNHGGTPLSFSDLLMSIAVASWRKEARKQIDDLVDKVRQGADMGFSIDRDWILKASLMLTDSDVRFKVENFGDSNVSEIENNWDEISACILATFRLIRSFGLNDASLRAKYAAIPVAYYLYHKSRDPNSGKRGLFSTINKQAFHVHDRKAMRKWLHMSLLKGVFGGQGDTLLANLRKIIKSNLASVGFPLGAIVKEFRGHSKDIRFDDDFISRLLKTQKDDASCFSILALLMPDLDYTKALQKDHIHPAAAFASTALSKYEFLKEDKDLRSFFEDRENWNSIVNLHLLEESKNKSKQDRSFVEWFKSQEGGTLDSMLIPQDAPLELPAFKIFFGKRYFHLKSILKSLGDEDFSD